MTVYDIRNTPSHSGARSFHTGAVSQLVATAVSEFVQGRKSLLAKSAEIRRNRMNRAAAENLRGLDAATLKDIGLTPGDVEYALSQPVSVNAAEVLNELRMSHRRLLAE